MKTNWLPARFEDRYIAVQMIVERRHNPGNRKRRSEISKTRHLPGRMDAPISAPGEVHGDRPSEYGLCRALQLFLNRTLTGLSLRAPESAPII